MISIAMATYNGEKYLCEQLDSILVQTYTDWELIVCDDCSSDGTVKILEEYAKNDSRIKVYVNEKNLGFKRNFEKAMGLCSGDYIALSDQDDVWTENHLMILYNNIGNFDLIGGNAYYVDSKLNSMGKTFLGMFKIEFLPENQEDWFFYLMHVNIFQGAAVLFRKKLLDKAFPIPDNFKFHDYWLALIANALGNGVTYTQNKILYYRQHDNNVTKEHEKNKTKKILALRKKIRENLESKITTLTELYPKLIESKQKDYVTDAVKYFENQRKGHLIKTVTYFIKNYKRIYLSRSKLLFLLRLMKKTAVALTNLKL